MKTGRLHLHPSKGNKKKLRTNRDDVKDGDGAGEEHKKTDGSLKWVAMHHQGGNTPGGRPARGSHRHPAGDSYRKQRRRDKTLVFLSTREQFSNSSVFSDLKCRNVYRRQDNLSTCGHGVRDNAHPATGSTGLRSGQSSSSTPDSLIHPVFLELLCALVQSC